MSEGGATPSLKITSFFWGCQMLLKIAVLVLAVSNVINCVNFILLSRKVRKLEQKNG